MRSANPPVDFASRGFNPPRTVIEPAKILVIANAISLSRGFAAIGILMMALAGASASAVLVIASAMWLTDILDGWVARQGRDRGVMPRTDGAALDPLMDDVAFVCGFLVLFSAGVVPLWFVAGLLVSRVLFSLIRVTGLAHREPFARAQPMTKASGAVLAVGQLLLLAHVAFPETAAGSDRLVVAVIATMTATTAYSVFQFAIRRHGRTLARLLTP
jgi:phosphatidylglycerophosphate synthase